MTIRRIFVLLIKDSMEKIRDIIKSVFEKTVESMVCLTREVASEETVKRNRKIGREL